MTSVEQMVFIYFLYHLTLPMDYSRWTLLFSLL
ncbi:hypothetical protein BDFB_013119 [Asbolus verrucosus]|uniref:Uncharacterized protein n=1 Tax=Asbolus verrucosus TaxID=1661398 RepID=A0A482W8A4_ASBVE|nr:hypothetical protein BDFB_013119 [Asbolus verrucosus]